MSHEAYQARQFAGDYYDKPGNHTKSFLNAAAVPRPLGVAGIAAHNILLRWEAGTLSKAMIDRILKEGRASIASLVNAEDPSQVVFGLNVTHVFSALRWLSGMFLQPQERRVAIMTDVDCPSIERSLRWICTEGNPEGGDDLTTYSNSFLQHEHSYPPVHERSTGIEVQKLRVRHRTNREILRDLEAMVTAFKPILVIFSHVLRRCGRILPAEAMTAIIRRANPETFVCIDGAQSVGNLPKVDFRSLGCDALLLSPGKTMLSTPLGVGVVARKHLDALDHDSCDIPSALQVIPEGMFDSRVLQPNVSDGVSYPDIAGLTEAVGSLHGMGYLHEHGDFSPLHTHRMELREHCRRRLHATFGGSTPRVFEVTTTYPEWQSSFIHAWRIGSRRPIPRGTQLLDSLAPTLCQILGIEQPLRGKRLAQLLGTAGVSTTYLGYPDDVHRLSYAAQTTESDIDLFVEVLDRFLRRERS